MQTGESFNQYIDRLMTEEAARKAGGRSVSRAASRDLDEGPGRLIQCGDGLMVVPREILNRSSRLLMATVRRENGRDFIAIPDRYKEVVFSSYMDYSVEGSPDSAVASLRNLVNMYPDEVTAKKVALAIQFASYLKDKIYSSAIEDYLSELSRDSVPEKRQVASSAWDRSGVFGLW